MGYMDRLMNLEACEPSYRYYGGDAGRKVGILIDDEPWLLKFPGPTGHLVGSVPSYTSAPLSEYLGSQVYGLLGIPVHETRLGIREGKVVCACRDFVQGSERLVEFRDLKNSLSDDEPGFSEAPSSGRGVVLADVRAAIHRIPVLAAIPSVSERFWDMFVTDAFIRNIDRNNTNWGILMNGTPARLAPVYDNGGSFFNKRTERTLESRLTDPEKLRMDAMDVRSCYTDDRGHQIAPLKYLMSAGDEECNAAVLRFMDRYEPACFEELLQSIPSQTYGVTVITDAYRDYHTRVLRLRYEEAFLPAWRAIRG